jgi:S-adenosyl methyltransferase
MSELGDVPPGVDPTRPSPARLYDYFLGGTNNFPADRQVAEYMKAHLPDVVDALLANRGFHGRAAAWMARQGIRQFLDIGSGLPTQDNTHEWVQRVAPQARVVYVDNDPMVAAHADALLAPGETTAVIMADLRDPDALLGHPDLLRLIDFAEPAGVVMTDVLHFLPDDDDPWGLVARYMAATAPGSYLAISHGAADDLPSPHDEVLSQSIAQTTVNLYRRSRADVTRFFEGLELLAPYEGAEPGISYAGLWGAEDPEAADSAGARAFYCGVARRVGTPPRRG